MIPGLYDFTVGGNTQLSHVVFLCVNIGLLKVYGPAAFGTMLSCSQIRKIESRYEFAHFEGH